MDALLGNLSTRVGQSLGLDRRRYLIHGGNDRWVDLAVPIWKSILTSL